MLLRYTDMVFILKLHLKKFSKREPESIKMCCINIQLTIKPWIFKTNIRMILLCMTVIQYQNKTLYNKIFFCTNLTDLLVFSRIHRTQLKFSNRNQAVQYITVSKYNTINDFGILQTARYSFIQSLYGSEIHSVHSLYFE